MDSEVIIPLSELQRLQKVEEQLNADIYELKQLLKQTCASNSFLLGKITGLDVDPDKIALYEMSDKKIAFGPYYGGVEHGFARDRYSPTIEILSPRQDSNKPRRYIFDFVKSAKFEIPYYKESQKTFEEEYLNG